MQVIDGRAGQLPLPSTWIKRTLRISYLDCYGGGVETTGVLVELCAAGPILVIDGAKTLLSWDRIVVAELVED